MFAFLWLAAAAFPGAEGFGALAQGGRGGDSYAVTTLSDSGPGSLRDAIGSAKGPRTITFRLSGVIELASPLEVDRPFLTITGEGAPAGGITISGYPVRVTKTHDVILRYLRIRLGDAHCPDVQDDALHIERAQRILIDHVSVAWSIDETLSITHSDQVTVQWSLITSSLNESCHAKGAHGYGSLLRYGNGSISMHHNLYAHHRSRNPRVGDAITLDFTNNVIYNYGSEATYTGPGEEGSPRINYRANVILPGPSTPKVKRTRAFTGGSAKTQLWQEGNLHSGADSGWAMFQGEYTRSNAPFDAPKVTASEAAKAYEDVLEKAGCRPLDSYDALMIEQVKSRTGRHVNTVKEALAGGSTPK